MQSLESWFYITQAITGAGPPCLTVGRTIAVGGKGDALDLSLGAYGLAVKPDGGADWQLKFGISWFLP